MTTIGLAALLLIVYTYAGYPLLVAVLSKFAPQQAPVQNAFEPMVSICIAIHNGARELPRKLQSLDALDYPREKIEVLLYSDGSTDATERVARDAAATDPRVRLMSDPVRRGKPAALNRLSAEAKGEVLIMTDVRQPLAPGALKALLRSLADPRVGCVSGSLVLQGGTGPSAYWRYESSFARSRRVSAAWSG